MSVAVSEYYYFCFVCSKASLAVTLLALDGPAHDLLLSTSWQLELSRYSSPCVVLFSCNVFNMWGLDSKLEVGSLDTWIVGD